MVGSHLMFNRKKIKANKSVGRLIDEYIREDGLKYDDGKRNIDVSKTKDNVVLLNRFPNENYDEVRKNEIQKINDLRAERQKNKPENWISMSQKEKINGLQIIEN